MDSPLENPTKKATASKLCWGKYFVQVPFGGVLSAVEAVENGSVAYSSERPPRKTQAEQDSDTVLMTQVWNYFCSGLFLPCRFAVITQSAVNHRSRFAIHDSHVVDSDTSCCNGWISVEQIAGGERRESCLVRPSSPPRSPASQESCHQHR